MKTLYYERQCDQKKTLTRIINSESQVNLMKLFENFTINLLKFYNSIIVDVGSKYAFGYP